MNKKGKIIFVFLCIIIILFFPRKSPFYIHKEVPEIEKVTITKVFSMPGVGKEDKIENIVLKDKKEIEEVVSKLKGYSFRKGIPLEKTIRVTTEDITTIFITIYYYSDNKNGWDFDRLRVSCTKDAKVRGIGIICCHASSDKKYQGKMTEKTMQRFLEDMQIYFDK